MKQRRGREKTVLVGVLKNKSDLKRVLKDHWYRIPVVFLPKKKFEYIALYQPAVFGKFGKRITYYARVVRTKVVRRIDILPEESRHPRALDKYIQIFFKKIEVLPKPIRNIVPRRVTFGFTSLKALFNSQDILELYGVEPTEQIIEKRLNRAGIKTVAEHTVTIAKRRFRLDLAVFCEKGKIAIECDNHKAHSTKIQKEKDKIKDIFLRNAGWRVVRLTEKDIIEKLNRCIGRIVKVKKALS